ncbi:phosphoenolpyruvate--protein phosphotransferase [Corynebacterium guangdongense]|uniref:Phosphoenolpyruvate-protein phosphotransferase n=1 Tax=Corynebacterium guangdongense TaxID=1783348 RepID=A0ABU1ZV51_9CORY|nr:phosphoenolpyruvate--protein phosphotransferase [Corynebacterium guangdongense]MDR7328807.1 phosphotransferase system enzyme I (PtsI) [Corynebacterium guangdongense]WJZ17382.1 Phosphoenolpyruvate-protein phosphotransferase [Corynebacterium guangdongense]
MSIHEELTGIGVSVGVATAPVARIQAAPGVDPTEPKSTDPVADAERVRAAMQAVSDDLLARAAEANDTGRQVLEATAQMAKDKGLLKTVTKKLKTGSGVTQAVHDAAEQYAGLLAGLGGYMAERVTDLYDVRDRTISQLRGLPMPGVPRLEEPTIIVAADLAPAETAQLDPAKVAGIVTSAGGATSHTAILAAQLGIPAVVRVQGALGIAPGTRVAIDGGAGRVIINPVDADIEQLVERQRRRDEVIARATGRGATADGRHVQLLVNIGSAEDAAHAATTDAEGTGLFRTEFVFLDTITAPTVEEQTRIYSRVLDSFGAGKVVVRTLDAGADKQLPFAQHHDEDNPALGIRGLRLTMERQELMDSQLDALAAAWEATGRRADLQVMAPMVATVEEARWFAGQVRARGLPKVGVMVEVPAAALRADRVLREVDFASIGTNDLAQYTMAADRMQGALAPLLDAWQPALLELVRATCRGGAATDAPVGVCGEAGGDPLLALVLVGLGVHSLSMAAGKIPAVRAALSLHDLATCQAMAAAALDADTAAEAREAVLALADPSVQDLL